MQHRFLTWCLSVFAWLFAFCALGCASLSLEALQARNPAAKAVRVCRRPLNVPAYAQFWAHRYTTGETVWDADRGTLERFVETADVIYEIEPNASASSVQELPPPYDELTCHSIADVLPSRGQAQRAATAPQSIMVAIDDELFAELRAAIESLPKPAEKSRADPRYFGQQANASQLRPIMLPVSVEYFLTRVKKSLQTGTPLPAPTPEREPRAVDHPVAQVTGGFAAGLSISLVPLGTVGADVAIQSGAVKPGTQWAHLGKNGGQLVGSLGQVVIGCGGMGLGIGATSTGGGAPAGLILTTEGATIAANGIVGVCATTANTIQLLLHWRDDGSTEPSVTAPPPAPAAAPPAAAPPTPAKPAAATPPAKPAGAPATAAQAPGTPTVKVNSTGTVKTTTRTKSGAPREAKPPTTAPVGSPRAGKPGKRSFSKGERAQGLERAKDPTGVPRCEYCKKELDRTPGKPNSYEADHRTPHVKGGPTTPENLAPACRTCNRSKGAKTPEEWSR